MQKPDDETKWVHEYDYGSFDLWAMVSGIFMVLVGLVQLCVYGIRRIFRR